MIGALPLLGDLFDVVFKANSRNLRLLGDALAKGTPPRDPRGVLRLASMLIVAVVAAILAATALVTLAIWRGSRADDRASLI